MLMSSDIIGSIVLCYGFSNFLARERILDRQNEDINYRFKYVLKREIN